jgi:ferredoxin
VERSLILASSDAPALDLVACKLSGFSQRTVPTVKNSVARRLVDPKKIEVVGDEAKVMKFRPAPGSPTDFAVIPRPVRAMLRSTLSPVPKFNTEFCVGCHVCVRACPVDSLTHTTPPRVIKRDCIRCYCCQELCPHAAVAVPAFSKKLGAPARALRRVIKPTGKIRHPRQDHE